MTSGGRADIDEFLSEQSKFLEQYAELLEQARRSATDLSTDEASTVLASEAQQALELLQLQQSRWQRHVRTQVNKNFSPAVLQSDLTVGAAPHGGSR